MAHGQALRALISKSSLILVLAIILVLLIVSAIAADDYVDVPAEYYFGRWAQGHYGTIDGIMWTDDSPVWKTGYGFASESFRVSIPQFEHYGLWDTRDNEHRITPVSIWWRPGSRWQFGVTDFTYSERESSGFSQTYPSIQRFQTARFSLELPVQFVSIDTMRLAHPQALYSYYVTNFVPAGRFVLGGEAQWRQQDYDSYVAHVRLYQDSLYDQESELRDNGDARLLTEISGTYGLTPDINLSGRLSFTARGSRGETWVETIYPNLTYSMGYRRYEYFDYTTTYLVGLRARTFGSVWTRASLFQDYRWETHETATRVQSNSGPSSVERSESSSSTSPYSTALAVGLDYISPNGFHPAALLDDYQDYYGHLLSERQWYVHLLFTAQWFKHYNDDIRLEYQVRNGWSDHFEVGLSGDYSVRRYDDDRIKRELTMDLQVRWRTYRYEPGKGPGWERDSRYDIAFGSIPRTGHWFGTFKTNIFEAYDPTVVDASAIAFWDLKYDIGFENYTLTHRLGLGRQIALEATQTIRFAGQSLSKLHIDRHYYTIGVVGRPLPMIQVSLALKDTFYNYSNYSVPAEWRVSVQGLL